jgi:hypothetical protein
VIPAFSMPPRPAPHIKRDTPLIPRLHQLSLVEDKRPDGIGRGVIPPGGFKVR